MTKARSEVQSVEEEVSQKLAEAGASKASKASKAGGKRGRGPNFNNDEDTFICKWIFENNPLVQKCGVWSDPVWERMAEDVPLRTAVSLRGRYQAIIRKLKKSNYLNLSPDVIQRIL